MSTRDAVRRAVFLALFCVGGWAPFAHAETDGIGPTPAPRTEFFVDVGRAVRVGHEYQNEGWAAVHVGAAYCVTRTIAFGVSSGWNLIASRERTYFPPGLDFVSAEEGIALIPAIGYVKARLPMRGHGGVPYVMAGAGAYTVLTRTTATDLPRRNDTRLGLCAAIGFAGPAGTWFPQLEARYDARPAHGRDTGLIWPQSRLDVITVSLGLQLP